MITHPDPFPALEKRSTAAIVRGENRRKMIYESLAAIDDQIKPVLKKDRADAAAAAAVTAAGS